MKKLLRLLLLVLLWVGLVAAQTATVTKNANLRPDPSTANDPVEKLTPPAQVQLIEPNATGGYFHVKAADGQAGFVWGRNIHVQTGPSGSTASSTGSTATATSGPFASGQALFNALMAARKDAVGQPLVENGNSIC